MSLGFLRHSPRLSANSTQHGIHSRAHLQRIQDRAAGGRRVTSVSVVQPLQAQNLDEIYFLWGEEGEGAFSASKIQRAQEAFGTISERFLGCTETKSASEKGARYRRRWIMQLFILYGALASSRNHQIFKIGPRVLCSSAHCSSSFNFDGNNTKFRGQGHTLWIHPPLDPPLSALVPPVSSRTGPLPVE